MKSEEFRNFTYRRPLTADGIKQMDKGTVKMFSPESYANFNTGTLEQYLDEEARVKSFNTKQWDWPKVLIGILFGIVFAIINQYGGLKIGIIVGGNWYLVYVLGMALRWNKNTITIAAGASTGASSACTGFTFTFPALYLLAYGSAYLGTGGSRLITPEMIPNIATAFAATVVCSFFGLFLFIIFRKIWLLEDPLPCPGFEATIKLVDIANDVAEGTAKKSMRSIIQVAVWTGISGLFTFLKDFPIIQHSGKTVSIFDWLFNSSGWYSGGKLMVPYKYDNTIYTHIDFALSPMMFATGWFMKARSAFLVAAGSLLTWIIVVPAAMLLNVDVYVPSVDAYKGILDSYFTGIYASTPLAAYKEVAVPIAIGAILGGGITALLKMSKVFVSCFKDMMSARTSEKKDYIGGKGWYEWPYSHIGISAAIMLLGLPLILIISGFPWPQSIATSIVLFILTLFLSAIAVKVMGEIRTTPVSGTSFIMMIALAAVLSLLGTEPKLLVLMTLFGTALFGTACSLASDVVSDFKTAIYCGTRPYYQMKGEIIGMVPGAVAAIIGATILSRGLAMGLLDLSAPQANAFAKFAQALVGGQAPYLLMGIGLLIGVAADILTGMGTSFGLGMYFPLSTSLAILLGGISRTLWEKNALNKNAKKYNWSEKERTLKLIDTFMASTGLIVGEALVGTIIGLYLVVPMMFGG